MFLDLNAEEKHMLHQYSKEHLHQLSVELVSEYNHDGIIPAIGDTYGWKYDETTKGLIFEFVLKKICPSTIYKWLKLLGIKHKSQRKGYYVDGNEKPETVDYRNNYVQRYLMNERHMYHWIQIPEEESNALEI